MKEDQFWQLIKSSRDDSDGTIDGQAEVLANLLAKLKPKEIAKFDRRLRMLREAAYTWDLWGAAYIMLGGCSDDSFEYFRNWLIAQGRKVYERALQDADSLAELDLDPDDDDLDFEGLTYLANEVYEELTDDELPAADIGDPEEPSGEPWDEEGDELAQRFPKLWAKYEAFEE